VYCSKCGKPLAKDGAFCPKCEKAQAMVPMLPVPEGEVSALPARAEYTRNAKFYCAVFSMIGLILPALLPWAKIPDKVAYVDIEASVSSVSLFDIFPSRLRVLNATKEELMEREEAYGRRKGTHVPSALDWDAYNVFSFLTLIDAIFALWYILCILWLIMALKDLYTMGQTAVAINAVTCTAVFLTAYLAVSFLANTVISDEIIITWVRWEGLPPVKPTPVPYIMLAVSVLVRVLVLKKMEFEYEEEEAAKEE